MHTLRLLAAALVLAQLAPIPAALAGPAAGNQVSGGENSASDKKDHCKPWCYIGKERDV